MSFLSKISEIEPGDHLCMIYDDDRDKLYTEILFIVDGLKNGEQVILINESEEELTSILSQLVDVRRFIDKKQLIFLSKDESYLRDGFFDADRMLKDIAELDENALAEGYVGLRLIGNASSLSYPKVEKLLEFEAKLNKLLPLTRSVVLCLFDERMFDPDFLLKALQAHPKLIAGKEVKENLNYTPPDEFLKKLNGIKRKDKGLQKLVSKKLEREFREMEEKFRQLFESSFEAVIILKGDRIVSCNPKAMDILGIRNFRQLLGRRIYDIFGNEGELKSRIEAAKAEPQFFELSLNKKGKKVELEASLTKVSDKLMMIARDVTERKEIEKKLKESEQRYRTLVESSIDAIITVNSRAEILTWNKGAEKIYGYKAEEVMGEPLTILIPERFRERFWRGLNFLESTFKPGFEFDHPQGRIMEVTGLRKNGEEFPAELSYHAWKSNDEIFFTCIVRDITERKKLEESLKESEEMFRTLAEKSLVGIYLIQDGVFKYVNPKLAKDFGYPVEEIVGRPVLDFIYPPDREIVAENIRKRISGEIQSIRYYPRVRRKDGVVRTFEVLGVRTTLAGKPAILGTAIDVTGEKIQKKRLEAYERFFRNAQDLFFILDSKARFVDVNPRYAEMLGYTKEELVGHTARKLMDPNEIEMVREMFRKVMEGRVVRYEAKAISKDRKRVYLMEVTLWPIFENGKVVGAEGIVRDITERKRTEERLRESEAMYKETADFLQRMIDIAPVAIVGWDLNYRVNMWNKAAERMFGWKANEVVGKDLFELHVAEKEKKRVRVVIEEVMRSGISRVNVNENLTKDGRRLIVEWYNFAVKDAEGSIVGGASIGVDLTRRIEMERRLMESEEKYRKIFESSPNFIAILDEKGVFVEANPAMIERVGLNPVGRTVYDVIPDVAEKRLELIRKALKENKVITFQVSEDRKYFINSLIPIELPAGRHCLVMSRDVTELVRLNRLLNALNNINKLIVHEKDGQKLLEKACDELASLEEYSTVTICLVEDGEIRPTAITGGTQEFLERMKECMLVRETAKRKVALESGGEICSECKIRKKIKKLFAFPMIVDEEVKGVLTIHLAGETMSDEEREMLQTLANDLAYAIKAIEMEELKSKAYRQIEKNLEQYAILIDHIRNPLAAILGLAEMEVENEELRKKLENLVYRIEGVVEKLDKGWLESEEIRKFLKRSQ